MPTARRHLVHPKIPATRSLDRSSLIKRPATSFVKISLNHEYWNSNRVHECRHATAILGARVRASALRNSTKMEQGKIITREEQGNRRAKREKGREITKERERERKRERVGDRFSIRVAARTIWKPDISAADAVVTPKTYYVTKPRRMRN